MEKTGRILERAKNVRKLMSQSTKMSENDLAHMQKCQKMIPRKFENIRTFSGTKMSEYLAFSRK